MDSDSMIIWHFRELIRYRSPEQEIEVPSTNGRIEDLRYQTKDDLYQLAMDHKRRYTRGMGTSKPVQLIYAAWVKKFRIGK